MEAIATKCRHSSIVMIALIFFCCRMIEAAEEAQIGTIEQLSQDNGSLTISGRTFEFSDSVTEIYLRDRRLTAEKLDTGMVVRYIVDTGGMILRLELMGPADKLMLLDQH